MKRLSTGIDKIDRFLDGGFKAGRVVALVSPPDTQHHAICHQLMRERPTVYITTIRPTDDIVSDLGYLSDQDITVTIEEVGETVRDVSTSVHELAGSKIHSVNTTERSQILDDIYDICCSIDGSRNVIIDSMNPLERSESRSAFQNLLTAVKSKLRETDSLGVLYAPTLENEQSPPLRDMTLTVADIVWKLNVVSTSNDDLELQMHIPKNRGDQPLLEQHSLLIRGAEVNVDDSRTI